MNLTDIITAAVKDVQGEQYSKVCKVDSVDTGAMTCEVSPLDDTAPILNVRLIAGETETPVACVPKSGSMVLVTFLNSANAFVSMFSEVEAVSIRGDQFGGLIKVEELRDQLKIMTERIDTLYDAINDATTAAQDGGATLQTTMKLKLATQIQTEDFEKIENESIKHG